MFSTKPSFDKLLEKATSQLLLEPDWDANIQICDAVRQDDVQPKVVIQSLKKKISSDNPHVSLLGLQVLETCVKNCGSTIHSEIATKEFMEFLKETVKAKTEPVKVKVLELIQIWSQAFRNESSYRIVQDTYNLMKMEGYQFPQLRESDAMFTAEKAPEWKDGETCHRCRTSFTFTNRKHHCRCCGEVFCGKCSSKNSLIPKFGIERDVRVCDACFDQLNKTSGRSGGPPGKEDELPIEYLNSPLAKQSQAPPAARSEEEIREAEELELALALSKSEAEEKEKQKKRMTANYGHSSSKSTPTTKAEDVQKIATVTPTFDTSEMDPELARYLNRNYWQQKAEESATQPSAPAPASGAEKSGGSRVKVEERMQNGEVNGAGESVEEQVAAEPSQEAQEKDQQQFLEALQSSIEIFVNRMKSDHMRGRSIANDSAVQTLFLTLNQMHPQLLGYLQRQDEKRSYYESLQDKLAQLRDAREALDVLREEHTERRRREQEEMERQRAIAMAQKLEVLRQKKHEYLEFQRQLALQRMRDTEAEMMQRMELQKRMQLERAMQYGSMPGYMPGQPGYMPGQPGYMPGQTMMGGQGFVGGSADGSPRHQPRPAAPSYATAVQYASLPYGMGPLMGPESLAQHQGQGGPLPGMTPGNWPAAATMNSYAPGPGDGPSQTQPGMYAHPSTQPNVPASGYPHGQAPPSSYPQASTVGQGNHPQASTLGQGYPGEPQMGANSMVMHPGEYNPYSMHGMAAALPPGGPPQHHPQMGQAPQPQGGAYGMVPGGPDQRWGGDPQQYMGGVPGQQHPPGAMAPPPQHQAPPPQPQQNDSQLISFD